MAKNEFNIAGGIQGGAVALGGDASNSGTANNYYDQRKIEAIQAELAKAEREIHAIDQDTAEKSDAVKLLTHAKADPTPSKLEAAVRGLKKVSTIAGLTEKTVGAISATTKTLITLGGLLG